MNLHVGVTASSDTFYPGQERYDTVSGRVTRRFRGSLAEWQELGVLNYEMEASTLFTMGAALGLRVRAASPGCSSIGTREEIPAADAAERVEAVTIGVAVDAARRRPTAD